MDDLGVPLFSETPIYSDDHPGLPFQARARGGFLLAQIWSPDLLDQQLTVLSDVWMPWFLLAAQQKWMKKHGRYKHFLGALNRCH